MVHLGIDVLMNLVIWLAGCSNLLFFCNHLSSIDIQQRSRRLRRYICKSTYFVVPKSPTLHNSYDTSPGVPQACGFGSQVDIVQSVTSTGKMTEVQYSAAPTCNSIFRFFCSKAPKHAPCNSMFLVCNMAPRHACISHHCPISASMSRSNLP